jgi:hypothetical protein
MIESKSVIDRFGTFLTSETLVNGGGKRARRKIDGIYKMKRV